MPIFRVYLRHPATTAPAWDYAETVVTACAAEAIAHAHAQWSHSRPEVAVPALPHCQTQAIMIETSHLLAASTLSPGQQAAIHELERRVSHLLHDTLHGTFRLVSAPAGLPMPLTEARGWRKGGLSTLDSLLTMAGNSQLTLSSERFSALYQHILRGIAFVWSEQDRAILRREESQASDTLSAVLAASASLRPATIWPADDALQAVFDQLCRRFGAPEALPDSHAALIDALAGYRARAGESYALRRWRGLAQARLDAALNHTQQASADNGGAALAAGGHQPAYLLDTPPATLWTQLCDTRQQVSLPLRLSDFTGEVVTVGLGNGMPFCLRVADVLTLHAGEQHELDLSRYVRADSRVSLTLDWSGVCALRPRPLALDAQARQGWYAREILREVLDLTWQPVSSLKLVNPDFDLNYLFGQGMAFSRLDHWVISQQPTLTLTLDRVDTARLRAELPTGAPARAQVLRLFNLGGGDSGWHVRELHIEGEHARLTLAAPAPDARTPRPAYVLGGVPAFPPLGV